MLGRCDLQVVAAMLDRHVFTVPPEYDSLKVEDRLDLDRRATLAIGGGWVAEDRSFEARI